MNFIGELAALATSFLFAITALIFTMTGQKPQVIRLLLIGAFIGPVLAVFLSLLAVQHTEIGVASTLTLWTKRHIFLYRYCEAKLEHLKAKHLLKPRLTPYSSNTGATGTGNIRLALSFWQSF
jgi:hypothetical protein